MSEQPNRLRGKLGDIRHLCVPWIHSIPFKLRRIAAAGANQPKNSKKPIHWKELLVSAASLAVISGGVTAALAVTNQLTKDTIAAGNEKAVTAALRQVMEAGSFEKQTLTDGGTEVIYYVASTDGDMVGYVFTATATGKSAGMVVMTGISVDGKISGVTVTDENETAGYLDKVKKAGLLNAFSQKTASGAFILGADVDAVSQATKTSKGVTDGVNQAVYYYVTYIKGAP